VFGAGVFKNGLWGVVNLIFIKFNLLILMSLILASTSPRRKEILDELGLDFTIVPSEFEEIIDQNLQPQQVVLDLAMGKARNVWLQYPHDIVLAADTIVFFQGKKLGKAKSREEARELLLRLSGQTCEIYTGNVLFQLGKFNGECTMATCHFDILTEAFVDQYLDDPEADWHDKAGSFAIQGKAKSFTHVEGEWSTAIGLSKEFVQKNVVL
jgi:septum formation protein